MSWQKYYLPISVNIRNPGAPAVDHEPSSFFHLAYPRTSRNSNIQPAVTHPTKGLKTPCISYNGQGMFIPNNPAIRVSTAIANDAMVKVNWS